MHTTVCTFSTELLWRQVISALPISPEAENLTPSLVTDTVTVSPMADRSRQMRWNSDEGILTVASNWESGMPSCSLSMSSRRRLNAEMRSWSVKQW